MSRYVGGVRGKRECKVCRWGQGQRECKVCRWGQGQRECKVCRWGQGQRECKVCRWGQGQRECKVEQKYMKMQCNVWRLGVGGNVQGGGRSSKGSDYEEAAMLIRCRIPEL